MQWVSDASFEAESRVNDKHDKAFYNGVAAGMRVALGDLELKELKAVEKYSDVNYHAKDNKAEEEQELVSIDPGSDEDVAIAAADAAPAKKKRGRPKKIVTASNSL
jgi:hypothetical protein